MDIGILGGTGPAGRALGARLASVGATVALGSRDPERAAEIAAGLVERWRPSHDLNLVGLANPEAAAADLVVLATPFAVAVSTAREVADRLAGKVLVSMVNALGEMSGELEALVPARGSIAVAVADALPGARVTGAFHHLPARRVGDLTAGIDADVLVCGDDSDAVRATISLADRLPGCRGVRAGSLSAAGAIESFTAVLIGVNIAYRSHVAFQLTGLADRG
jgi:NADPH-dependent F420 reductase